MERHIQISAEYNRVVCLYCQRGLTPNDGAIRHLRHRHQVKGSDLQGVKAYLSLGRANDPTTVELPLNGRARQLVIPVEPGFKCTACPFTTTSEKRANLHWTGVPHTHTGPRYTGVDVQSWMSGGNARCWVVRSRGYYATAQDRTGNEGQARALDTVLQNATRRIRESNEQWRRAGQAQQGADHDNAFVKDMRWVKFTEGKDRAVMSAVAEWVNAKNSDRSTRQGQEADADAKVQLTVLCEGAKRQVQRRLPRLYAVPRPILQWRHGIEEGKSNPVPFRMNEGADTLQKYGVICERYICCSWRAYLLGRDEAQDKLSMRFTDEQWSLLCNMSHELQKQDGSEHSEIDDSGFGSSDSTGYDSDMDQEARSSQPAQGCELDYSALDQIMFRFMIASIKTKVGGDMYANGLLCFLAPTATRSGGDGFRATGQFTGTLADMLWIMRLFFLENCFQDMPLNVEDISVEKMESGSINSMRIG